MIPPSAPNALYALASATLWGGGDFSGGMGVKVAGGTVRAALRIVLLSHATSFLVLVGIALARHDGFPHGALLAWGVTAGVAGGLALTCFYIALSRGAMGASAAVSGLLAAAIPTLVASYTDGTPGVRRIVGFSVAGATIWLIAGGPAKVKAARSTAALAVAAGAGFGVYFVALKMSGPAGVVWPMATARMGSLAVCSVWAFGMEAAVRGDGSPGPALTRPAVLWSLSTALLDTSGNLLFVAATRAGRLDIAAVLASLYPASTILLAAWRLKELPTRRQALGMAAAVLAVALISFG
ncbi:MAG: EamA family transporter [Acidobacteriota bacterium]|nr:EamA family transporter [Acidobacteriota bacterium]